MKAVSAMFTFYVIFSHVRWTHQIQKFDNRYTMTVTIDERVPKERCSDILKNFEAMVSENSAKLYRMFDGYINWEAFNIIIPNTWPITCIPINATTATYESVNVDMEISVPHPAYGDEIWTQQSRPCSEQGDRMYSSYRTFLNKTDIGSVFLREWIKYAFGVFDERGFEDDRLYPKCYKENDTKSVVNGCGRESFHSAACENSGVVSARDNVFGSLLSSTHFLEVCSEHGHNTHAPNKHNFQCGGKSVSQVVLSQIDITRRRKFSSPSVIYRRVEIPVVLFLIEDSQALRHTRVDHGYHQTADMYLYLKLALKKLVWIDLSNNNMGTEVGFVFFNETGIYDSVPLRRLDSENNRDMLVSSIPYKMKAVGRAGCIACALKKANEIFDKRFRSAKGANAHIIIIGSGTHSTTSPNTFQEIERAVKMGVRISAVTYPEISLDADLSEITRRGNGVHVLAIEKPNLWSHLNSTVYYRISKAIRTLVYSSIEGYVKDIPVQVYKGHIFAEKNDNIETGEFYIYEGLIGPLVVHVYTHSVDYPGIRAIKLLSPSGKTCEPKSDKYAQYRIIYLYCDKVENGKWKFIVERDDEAEEETAYIEILSKSHLGPWDPVITARTWFSEKLPILYAEVKRGGLPVSFARVHVEARKLDKSGSLLSVDKFFLTDTGLDPDLMANDGIYSRYYGAVSGGPGIYTFHFQIDDNDQQSFSMLYDENTESSLRLDDNCCGSKMVTKKDQKLSKFKVFPSSVSRTLDEIYYKNWDLVGKIMDLDVDINSMELTATLKWTSPDLNDIAVTHFSIYYAMSLNDITILSNSVQWHRIKKEEMEVYSYSLNFTEDLHLLGRTIYVVVVPYKRDYYGNTTACPMSNWKMINVPSPVLETTDYQDSITSTPSIPATGSGTELPTILVRFLENRYFVYIAIGVFVLSSVVVIIILVSCVRHRKRKMKGDNYQGAQKISSIKDIVSLPPSLISRDNSHMPYSEYQQQKQYQYDYKHQQPHQAPPYDHHPQERRFLSSNMTFDPQPYNHSSFDNTYVREKLSPYNSWSPSLLLNEHEKRRSPLDDESSGHMRCVQKPSYSYHNGYNVNPTGGANMNGNSTHKNSLLADGYTKNNLSEANPNLQGSLLSVSSTEKRRRNITMV